LFAHSPYSSKFKAPEGKPFDFAQCNIS
jgi:hypothetical protein